MGGRDVGGGGKGEGRGQKAFLSKILFCFGYLYN